MTQDACLEPASVSRPPRRPRVPGRGSDSRLTSVGAPLAKGRCVAHEIAVVAQDTGLRKEKTCKRPS